MKLLPFWVTVHLAISILGILMYVVGTHALQQHRHPAAAVSWMLCFFFVPYLALPAYLFFGQRKIRLKPGAGVAAPADPGAQKHHWLSAMMRELGAAPGRDQGQLNLHETAEQAERALFEIIDSARHRLYTSTYVLGDDRIGAGVIARLAHKARAGVEVRLLLDGVGCLPVRASQLRPLIDAGGHVARAFPPLRRLLRRQSNIRNHRKLLVVDGQWLWTGGRNYADEYFTGSDRKPAWYDLTLDVRGPLAHDAEQVFRGDWQLATRERLEAAEHPPPPDESPRNEVQLLPSGPDQPLDVLEALLVTACFRATRRILVVTPYLIPNPALIQAFVLAARRRVRVDIVIPAKSNHLLADLARSRAVRAMACDGVSVWLAPQMDHAKACVFDDFAMCGSANLDSRSLFLNFELTTLLYQPAAAEQLACWIEARRAESVAYQPTPVSLMRDLFEGAVLWVGFQL